ncbi:MAG: hypothetical protein RLW62_20190, partial [Gammaproteobacteria bacterium]
SHWPVSRSRASLPDAAGGPERRPFAAGGAPGGARRPLLPFLADGTPARHGTPRPLRATGTGLPLRT